MHANRRLAQALHGLSALTELNLRRNAISSVSALEALPSLQRLFLSNNAVAALSAIACLAEHEGAIQRVFRSHVRSLWGRYHVRLFDGAVHLRTSELNLTSDRSSTISSE